MKTICLKIYGIDCVACISTIQKLLKHIDGIQNCEINYSSSEALLTIDEKVINLDQVYNSLKNMDFKFQFKQ